MVDFHRTCGNLVSVANGEMKMSDHDDTCYWLGQPINAMTREKLQDALIECKLALMLKENEIVLLRHHLEIKNAETNDAWLLLCNGR